ncbi:SurA N-terminal domain-containing protein [Candidatus Saccharibacteria bacterium]|nr:SurA N-terminal domain-containing protein [Candidatus Saccharibacteria bacterium]
MKLFHKKDDKKTEQEKVDERREEVLATGRKFKYPLQWTKHRVVINTILISLVTLGILTAGGYLALYKMQMTDELLYRITQILPVPVAEVDGEKVRFSDYLMFYRSSLQSISRQSTQTQTEEDLDNMKEQFKADALTKAEMYTFAMKIARENGVSVSDEEVKNEFERHRQIGSVDRSEAGFLKIIKDNFGLSKEEYNRMIYLTLLKAKVDEKIDENANNVSREVEKLLAEKDGSFKGVVEEIGNKVIYEETSGMVSNKNVDGGRADAASRLNIGEQSGRFVSMNGDGYYYVKLVDKNAAEVNFVSIKIEFTEFSKQIDAAREAGKIKEYIEVKR